MTAPKRPAMIFYAQGQRRRPMARGEAAARVRPSPDELGQSCVRTIAGSKAIRESTDDRNRSCQQAFPCHEVWAKTNSGGLKMEWDQIERKWEEMTRRIQPSLSLPSTIRTNSSRDESGPLSQNIASLPGTVDAIATEPAV